jgi:hypothetical protein
MADEAHRSQYGFSAKYVEKSGELNVGFAQHMRDALPNATFIGFTGTPVELNDRNTRAVFGDYVSIYDIQLQPPDRLEHNQLQILRKAVRFDDAGPVLFVGSIMAEAGWLSFDEYSQLLVQVCDWFGGREVHYFPHRRENLERKRATLEEVGVTWVESDLPFELFLASSAAPPCAVAGFYTTVFDTLLVAGLAPEERLVAFALPEGCITDPIEAKVAAKCYERYRSAGTPRVVDSCVVSVD